jgi:hypothetical protein
MDNFYYSNTHYYTPTYNPLRTTPNAHIHLDSAAAQLGLTSDELTPILQDQQREYQRHKLEYEAAQPPLCFADTIHLDSAAAQLGLSMEDMEEILEDQREWMRQEEEEEQRYREARHTTAGTSDQEHHYNNNASARSTPPPLKHRTHGTTSDDIRTEPDPPDHLMIEPLERDQDALGLAGGDWAVEVDKEGGFMEQGMYMPTNYAPIPPTAPTLPTTPSTMKYMPPRTHYTRPPTKYIPSHSRFTPRYPPLRLPHPQRIQQPPCENQTGHVTATQHAHFRTTMGAADTGPPCYVPPALRCHQGTPHKHLLPPPNRSDKWRDPPPHKVPPTAIPKHSDSPNWCKASPGCSVSFQDPQPLPQTPSTPPDSPAPCKNSVCTPRPSNNYLEFQPSRDLNLLIQHTADALQSIIQVAEKLVWQINAERHLAHKLQPGVLGAHEDAPGNVVCPQPPTFPSGRGVPVAGPLGGLDCIA